MDKIVPALINLIIGTKLGPRLLPSVLDLFGGEKSSFDLDASSMIV